MQSKKSVILEKKKERKGIRIGEKIERSHFKGKVINRNGRHLHICMCLIYVRIVSNRVAVE